MKIAKTCASTADCTTYILIWVCLKKGEPPKILKPTKSRVPKRKTLICLQCGSALLKGSRVMHVTNLAEDVRNQGNMQYGYFLKSVENVRPLLLGKEDRWD